MNKAVNAAATGAYKANTAKNGYEFSAGSGYTLPEYPFVAPPELGQTENALHPRHPIVIIGAGISGLTLAASLSTLGVPCVVIDEDNTVGVKGASSRGICYAQKSLEIFKRVGIYERIAAKGVQWSVGRTFAGVDEVYSFNLREQATHNLSSEPPFINIQQFYVEGFLVERCYELGLADLRWKSRTVGFEQHADYATLDIETPAGTYRLEADFVVDATGVHSPFRQWLNMQVNAKKGDDRWCIADVRFSTQPALERHTWIEAPFNENRAVWQHLMADDVWRLDYQMAPSCDMAYVSREDVVRERLQRQFGAEVDCEVVWVGPYAYRSECLESFRNGSVFFVGDAAHVVSPFGARGGNSGVQDSDNLAWKLASVVRGEAAHALLDSYDAERREAGIENVQVTNRTARYLRAPEGAERVLRDATIALAKKHAFARAMVNTGRMSSPNTYTHSPACSAGGGGSVQNISFAWQDGSRGEMIDLLRWARGRLLVLVSGPISRLDVQRLHALGSMAAVRTVHVRAQNQQTHAIETIVDIEHSCIATLNLNADKVHYAVIRPDGYLAATGADIDATLVNALGRALGMPL
jgi:3-(3-hydroxy-phenyl)propionate hydroxylase